MNKKKLEEMALRAYAISMTIGIITVFIFPLIGISILYIIFLLIPLVGIFIDGKKENYMFLLTGYLYFLTTIIIAFFNSNLSAKLIYIGILIILIIEFINYLRTKK